MVHGARVGRPLHLEKFPSVKTLTFLPTRIAIHFVMT